MGNRPGRKINPRVAQALSNAEHLWQGKACELLKEALDLTELGYPELLEGLQAQGACMSLSHAALNQRINRGNFSADFLLLCFHVIGVKSVNFNPTGKIELRYQLDGRQASGAAALEQIFGFGSRE